MYEHLVYDGAKPVASATLSPRSRRAPSSCRGFSKTYSMTGWRLGTLVAPAPIAKAVASCRAR
jgi:aspartate aminotransferase